MSVDPEDRFNFCVVLTRDEDESQGSSDARSTLLETEIEEPITVGAMAWEQQAWEKVPM